MWGSRMVVKTAKGSCLETPIFQHILAGRKTPVCLQAHLHWYNSHSICRTAKPLHQDHKRPRRHSQSGPSVGRNDRLTPRMLPKPNQKCQEQVLQVLVPVNWAFSAPCRFSSSGLFLSSCVAATKMMSLWILSQKTNLLTLSRPLNSFRRNCPLMT